MHLNATKHLFGNAQRQCVSARLGILLVALMLNALWVNPQWLIFLLVTGLVVSSFEGAIQAQKKHFLVLFSYGILAIIVFPWFMGDIQLVLKFVLKFLTGCTWVLWFRGHVDWLSLKKTLQYSGVPTYLIDFMDQLLSHGLLLMETLYKTMESALVRNGFAKGQPKVQTVGLILANGIDKSFHRAIRLEDARLLKGSGIASVEKSSADDPISLQNVSVAYSEQDTPCLQAISLNVRAGEWVAIMGPSGSGKSTLLRAMSGLMAPCTGELKRFGVVVPKSPVVQRMDSRLAFVFQDPNDQLFGSTPLEDLLWGLARQGYSEEEATPKALQVLDELGIAHLACRPFQSLSFGERKRSVFASALACDPQILLCDEPTSGLDPVAKNQLIGALEQACQRTGCTVVWVTHDIFALPQNVRRVVMISRGRIVFEGPKEEALTSDRLIQTGLCPSTQSNCYTPTQEG